MRSPQVRPLIERPSHADTSAVECSNAGVNAHTNSTLDLYTIAERADRRSPTIPSLRRSDGPTPGTSEPSAGRQEPDRAHARPYRPRSRPSRASTPLTHRVGAVHRSPTERERQPDAQRGQSDPGAKATRVMGRRRAGAPVCEPLRWGWSTCPCAGASPRASSLGRLGGRQMEADRAADQTALPSGRRRKGGRGPVRGPRPLGIELPGARALTPSSASRRAGPRRSAAPCGARTRSLPMRGSERKAPGQGARWRRRGRGRSAAPSPRPRRSYSWSGRGVPATGPAHRVRQPWRLR